MSSDFFIFLTLLSAFGIFVALVLLCFDKTRKAGLILLLICFLSLLISVPNCKLNFGGPSPEYEEAMERASREQEKLADSINNLDSIGQTSLVNTKIRIILEKDDLLKRNFISEKESSILFSTIENKFETNYKKWKNTQVIYFDSSNILLSYGYLRVTFPKTNYTKIVLFTYSNKYHLVRFFEPDDFKNGRKLFSDITIQKNSEIGDLQIDFQKIPRDLYIKFSLLELLSKCLQNEFSYPEKEEFDYEIKFKNKLIPLYFIVQTEDNKFKLKDHTFFL